MVADYAVFALLLMTLVLTAIRKYVELKKDMVLKNNKFFKEIS
ncbi:hypothetical protein [Geoglobus acetivorans]